jgi:3-methylfumaryl-CoA hydratase
MNMDIDHLRTWIGRREKWCDIVTHSTLQGLLATLDRDEAAATDAHMPLGSQWLYVMLPMQRRSQLGEDGHPRRGDFLPPVPLPRRMWAGGDAQFLAPIVVGQALTRSSVVQDVVLKNGQSGPLVFVDVRHEYRQCGGVCVVERQDIVYRDDARGHPGAVDRPPVQRVPDFSRRIVPDTTLLFRYSALSYNGHRIHYDRPYAQQVEGYSGLVVHGPLIATLLLDLVRDSRPDVRIARFRFRGVRPLIDTDVLTVCGAEGAEPGTFDLWAHGEDGFVGMSATAWLS